MSAAADVKAQDQRFMVLALALGRRGLGHTWPNPAVGAVVVHDDAAAPMIVGRGWTQRGGRPHAEIEALGRAGSAARGATLYVTLEPCSHYGKTPPCADAIIAAGVSRVVSALEDANPLVSGQGHARLRAAGIAVDVGLRADDARRDHAGHIQRVTKGRPHVMLKLAISADGKAAASGNRAVAITGEATQQHVHLMRAQSDAIMIGVGTALTDDPMLTCRLPGMAADSPVRVVLDRTLRLPLQSRLLRSARAVPLWIIGGPGASSEAELALRAQGAEVFRSIETDGGVDLAAALRLLAAQGITRLMVEGGPTLAAALIAADLVDEAHLFHSDVMIGSDGVDALAPGARVTFEERLTAISRQRVGTDRHNVHVRR